MKERFFYLILTIGISSFEVVQGHGRLLDPPSRASMWRKLYAKDPMLLPYRHCIKRNYDDNQLFCGGFGTQQRNRGKCGVCGDSYSARIKNHEAPKGKYAKGIITRQYAVGEIITVKVEITAAHKGYFEFRLCPWNKPNQTVTHECLNRYLLTFENNDTKWYLPKLGVGKHNILVSLPTGVQCQQCVLQWRYKTGNSWGTDENGISGLGKGPQEEFYACADIAIGTSERLPTLCSSKARPSSRPGNRRPSSSFPQSNITHRFNQQTLAPTPSSRPSRQQRPKRRRKKKRNEARYFCLGCNRFYRCVYRRPVKFNCPLGTACKDGRCIFTPQRC